LLTGKKKKKKKCIMSEIEYLDFYNWPKNKHDTEMVDTSPHTPEWLAMFVAHEIGKLPFHRLQNAPVFRREYSKTFIAFLEKCGVSQSFIALLTEVSNNKTYAEVHFLTEKLDVLEKKHTIETDELHKKCDFQSNELQKLKRHIARSEIGPIKTNLKHRCVWVHENQQVCGAFCREMYCKSCARFKKIQDAYLTRLSKRREKQLIKLE